MVEVVDVPDARPGEELEALFHLGDGPVEREDDLAVVGYDGDEQVGDRRIWRELDALRVDHDELQLLGGACHEKPADERVEANRLALPGRARDEHVGHRREVGDELLAVGALAEEKGKLRLRAAPCLGLEYLPERDAGRPAVRDLYADPVFARDWRLDADGLRVERSLEVVVQVRDGRISRSRGELDRVFRDDGSLHRVAQSRVHAEELERRDEALAHFADVAVVGLGGLERRKKRSRRQDVRPLVLDRGLAILAGLCACGPGPWRGRDGGGLRCGRRAGELRGPCRLALGPRRLLRRAYGLLLGLAGRGLFGLCALLFEPRLLLFEPRLLLGVLLRLERGEVGRLLGFVLLVGASCLARRRDCPRSRSPAVKPREEAEDRLDADAFDERDERDHRHDRGTAEVAQERRDEARHDEIAHHAACVGYVDAVEGGRYPRRVALRHLEKARACGEQEREPRDAPAEAQPAPAHEAEPERHADDGDYPHCEADDRVAVVGERVAECADPVRGRQRGNAKRRDRAPVVGQQRHEREERHNEKQPPEDMLLDARFSGIRRGFCHFGF